MRNNMKKKVWLEEEIVVGKNSKITIYIQESINISDKTSIYYIGGVTIPLDKWDEVKEKVDEMLKIRNAEIGAN
jgi:predicted acyltransferase (DUF342 family)